MQPVVVPTADRHQAGAGAVRSAGGVGEGSSRGPGGPGPGASAGAAAVRSAGSTIAAHMLQVMGGAGGGGGGMRGALQQLRQQLQPPRRSLSAGRVPPISPDKPPAPAYRYGRPPMQPLPMKDLCASDVSSCCTHLSASCLRFHTPSSLSELLYLRLRPDAVGGV